LSGRVVFPPGEGIGRTRPGAGSRPRRGRFRPLDPPCRAIASGNSRHPPGRPLAISRTLRTSPDESPYGSPDPSPDGPPTPPLMGPPRGGGPAGADLGPFALVRRWSPPDQLNARRWASFVGPLRAKSWRADDWAGPAAGRAIARDWRKPVCGYAAIPHFNGSSPTSSPGCRRSPPPSSPPWVTSRPGRRRRGW
jgi:hypothetical protein